MWYTELLQPTKYPSKRLFVNIKTGVMDRRKFVVSSGVGIAGIALLRSSTNVSGRIITTH